MSHLRHLIAPPEVVEPSSVVHDRGSIRVSPRDDEVLRAVGSYLGQLAGEDLALRCAFGLAHGKEQWAERKRALTERSSSRWAGSITKTSNDAWNLARRNQFRQRDNLRGAISALEKRLAQVTVDLTVDLTTDLTTDLTVDLTTDLAPDEPRASKDARKAKAPKTPKSTARGYATQSERYEKQKRLNFLRKRLRDLERDIGAGRVHICRGGRKLAGNRHNLEQAGLSESEWLDLWRAERLFFKANGESGKTLGNETIRVSLDGTLTVDLPAALAGYANVRFGRYVLDAKVSFPCKEAEWQAQVTANQAVAYTISYSPKRKRWYIDASFTPKAPAPTAPSLEALRESGLVAVDLNRSHLACSLLDASGNPRGKGCRNIPFDLVGSSERRDGRLREAISQLLHLALAGGVRAIGIEDLGFEKEKSVSRERLGRNKTFRKTINDFPTAQFRQRLVAMAARVGISVITVGPAYSSIWGAEYWQEPLSTGRHQASRHEAASVVIGRRSLGLKARRRKPEAGSGVTAPPAEHGGTGKPGESYRPSRSKAAENGGTSRSGGAKATREGVRPEAPMREAKSPGHQNRSGGRRVTKQHEF